MSEQQGQGQQSQQPQKRSYLGNRQWVPWRGMQMWLDRTELIDRCMIDGGAWEGYSTRLVERFVKPGMVVADIGANVGYYTMLLAKLVGPTGRVLAFEPMPEPAEVVRQQVARNAFGDHVSVHQVALDDRDAPGAREAFFNYSWVATDCRGDREGRGALPPMAQHGGPTTFRSMDSLVAELALGRLDFIKIDVDGYERRLLRGAEQTLRRLRPILLLEVCDYTMMYLEHGGPRGGYTCGDEIRAMLAGLRALGYRIFRESNLVEVQSTDELLAEHDMSRSGTNVLCAFERSW